MSDTSQNPPPSLKSDDERVVVRCEDPPPSPTHSMAETVAAETTKSTSAQKRARKITSVNKVDFSSSLERVNDTYVAKLGTGEPLVILTPPVVLKESLVDDEGETRDYVQIKLKRVYGDAFEDLESRLLQAAKARKVEWFQNDDLEDGFLENALRRFYDPHSKCLMVRVDDDVGGPLSTPIGSRIRCVLELNSAVFTRTQYGALWTMTLVKPAGTTENAYLFDPEEQPEHESITKHDLVSTLLHKDLMANPDEQVDV